ncbi:MAG: FtsX-like permease family protein [Planctomycetes bacterium]|nr:FtsX-like permease family protein [Planctomycetota bacterium]
MTTLLRLFSWRHYRRHRLRLVLSVLSITLGVALFVSMQVSRISTVRAFEAAAQRAAGRAEYGITFRRALGVDRRALELAESVPGVVATPALAVSTTLPDLEAGAVLLVGVDLVREARFRNFADAAGSPLDLARFLLDPNAVLLAHAFAAHRGIEAGRTLRINTPAGAGAVRVAGFLADRGAASVLGGNFAVMRVAAVQRLFELADRFDRIDLAAAAGGPLEAATLARLGAVLGDDYRIERLEARSGMLDVVLSRLRALVAVSLIALLVGLFIIYLSMSIAVVERSRDIGTLRALGASRGQIRTLLLLEAGVLGLVGSALGVALGYGLASGLLQATVKSINLLTHIVEVSAVTLSLDLAVAALAAGTLTAVAAALVPALRATRIVPLEVLRPAIRGARMAPDVRRGFRAGLVLIAAGFVGILGFYQRLPPDVGLGLTAAIFVGLALVLPRVTEGFARAVRAPLRAVFRVEGDLAARNVLEYPQRTALTVTALGGALAMMVATAATLGSFHHKLERWVKEAFPFDLTVWPASVTRSLYSGDVLPRELEARIRDWPGVNHSYGVRVQLQKVGDREVLLIAMDLGQFLAARERKGVPAADWAQDAATLAALRRGEAIGMSHNFGNLQGVVVGDRLELATRTGPRRFRVAFALEDFSYPLGSLLIDLDVYAELWQDPALSYVDLLVQDGHDVEAVARDLGRAVAEEHGAFVFRRDDVRRFALGALEQSFYLTHVQVLVAMVIGFFGILNALLISVLTRTREIGLLRSVGMTRRQVARSVVIEALFLAVTGGGCGVVWGLIAAALPVASHVTRLTGYTLGLVVPWGTVAAALAIGLGIGAVASLVPARRAARLNVLEAVGYE